jgi:hypothetical protein
MPPSLTEPVSRGLKLSLTSYCLSSPVPQHDTYSQRSSTDRSMSLMRGGTAPNGLSAGGSRSGSAGSAGMVTTLVAAQRSLSRYQRNTDPDRSSTLMTTPTNPQALAGSWAGRTSSTSWWASPRSTRWVRVRLDMLQKFRWWPNLRPSRSSGLRPFSTIEGVAHSEVIMVSCPGATSRRS